MSADYFVGRKPELERFDKFVHDPAGQAALVIGQEGLGKSTLIRRFTQVAEQQPDLRCRSVWYQVTLQDRVETTLALMMDHAFDAAQVVEGSFAATDRRVSQWAAVLEALVPKGDKLRKLVASLRRKPKRHIRDQFREQLAMISDLMPTPARALFVVDPEKYLSAGSDDEWRLIVQGLPPQIKFVFAQRPEDHLATSLAFRTLHNVVHIPDVDLAPLEPQSVNELIDCYYHYAAPGIAENVDAVRGALRSYAGHPYVIKAALDLLRDGTQITQLPHKPTLATIAVAQWRRVCGHSPDAVRLFKAYAVLEIAVPFDIAETVADVTTDIRQSLLANLYLAGLLSNEGDGQRVYHALLADHIRTQLTPIESRQYHQRAADYYEGSLGSAGQPDARAAVRLAEHVLALDEPNRFVATVIEKSTDALITLGLFDACMDLTRRALRMTASGSLEKSRLRSNLGWIDVTRGNFRRAERLACRAMLLDKEPGRFDRLATPRIVRGRVLAERGEYDDAQVMFLHALYTANHNGSQRERATSLLDLASIFAKFAETDAATDFRSPPLLDRLLGLVEAARGQVRALSELANCCQKLGDIYGAFDRPRDATRMYIRARKDNAALGSPQGEAEACNGLAQIQRQRRQMGRARKYWRRARDLYTSAGMPHMAEQVQAWLDKLPT